VKRVPVAEFKAHCSQYIDSVSEEEIVITRHGKPVARLVAERDEKDPWSLLGILRGEIMVDPDDDLLSTGVRWDAES